MAKKVPYILLPMLFALSTAFGQDYTFKVLANKGENQVLRESGESAALKTGAELFDLDEIISSDGAYVGLVHKSGKTLEVRGAGNRKVSELASKVNVSKTSAVSRYAKFIAAKMSEGDGTRNRDRTNTIGAVSRGFGDMTVLLPNSALEVYSSEAIIRWVPPAGIEEGASYTVTILDVFGEALYTEETDQEFIALNFDEIENESGFYTFQVQKSDDESVASGELGIKKVGTEDKPKVAEGLETLLPELTEDTPINNIVLATFYEESGLLIDAITQYERAIQSAPGVQDYVDMYNSFLEQNGIVEAEDE